MHVAVLMTIAVFSNAGVSVQEILDERRPEWGEGG